MRIRFVNKTQFNRATKFLREISESKGIVIKDMIIITMPYKNPFKNILREIKHILGCSLEILIDIWEIIESLCKILMSFFPCVVIRISNKENELVVKPEIRKGV